MNARRGSRRSDSDTKGAASAVVVFAVLALVVVVVAGAALLLMPDPAETPTPATSPAGDPSSPDLSLTDEEAIERLRELDAIRIQALENRDVALLDAVFTPDSPAAVRVRASIRTLIRDDVWLDQRRYEVQRSQVLSNTRSEIRIRQVVLVDVEFRDANGNRVTRGSGEERHVVVRTMKPVDSDWYFYDGSIVDARPI